MGVRWKSYRDVATNYTSKLVAFIMQWFHSSFIQGFHFCLSQEPAEPEVDHEEWPHMRTDGGSSVPLDGPPMENCPVNGAWYRVNLWGNASKRSMG